MTLNSNRLTFEQLGSNLDAFFSKVEARVNENVPTANTVKSTIINAPARIKGDLAIDLAETDDSFIVICDVPGMEKNQVQIKLLSQTTLSIKINTDGNPENSESTPEDTEVKPIEDKKLTYLLKERKIEPRERTIIFPAGVTAEGAKATFNNGVMEITLPKIQKQDATEITIE